MAISSSPPRTNASPSNSARVWAALTGLNSSTTPRITVASPTRDTTIRMPVCFDGVAPA